VQIVGEHDCRSTHKTQRVLAWIREKAKRTERALAENGFYRILAIASTLGLLVGPGKLFIELTKLILHLIYGR
jgi:hypothetical protein